MTNHAGQGKITHALPDGRKAHMPFASGITPVSGAAKYITEALNAVASLDGNYIPGCVALNIKFTNISNDEEVRRLGDFIAGYFLNKGPQVQFNIMSREVLEEARKNPSKYPDLLVRVSGYSAYFNDLSDIMKEELITRAQYDIASGEEV